MSFSLQIRVYSFHTLESFVFSFGVLLHDLDKEFDCGDGWITLAGSLYAGNQILVSPIIAHLLKKHDWRLVSSLGCLLNAIGFYLASRAALPFLGSYGIFIPKVSQLFLGLFISSFGACAMTYTGNLAVGLYFKEDIR